VVPAQALVMRRLEDVDVVAVEAVRRDDEALRARAEQPVAEDLDERSAQLLGAVLGPPEAAEVPAGAEDGAPLRRVEVDDLGRPQPSSERQGDEATCRSADDEVEVVSDSAAEVLLERCQDRCREEALQAAAIKRKNLEGRGGAPGVWSPAC
jgi:hypothetical protein